MRPWKVKGWIIPPLKNSDFVANMEHVLDIYKQPYNKENPLVCIDESPKQLIKETKTPLAMTPGVCAKADFE